MKYLLIAVLAVLSALHKEQVLGAEVGCPRRYLRRINGKCYYFSVKKLNWFGALNNCLRKGLTLADLSNPRDFYGAIGFLNSKGNTEDFWFGGNDLQHEGRFQYISSGRLVRFYSNYSIVEPADHSECDDCLEVRIRSNITVVADDNCMERQYFICSEYYCDEEQDVKKPRHHSHEHLHHFHHDIGEGSEDGYDNGDTPPPNSASVTDGSASEEKPGVITEPTAAPSTTGIETVTPEAPLPTEDETTVETTGTADEPSENTEDTDTPGTENTSEGTGTPTAESGTAEEGTKTTEIQTPITESATGETTPALSISTTVNP